MPARPRPPDLGASAARAGATTPADAVGDVELITAAMVRLAERVTGAAEWSAADRSAVLRRMDRVVDGLAAVRATVLTAERDAGTWQGAGDRSFEAWRARTGGTGRRDAAAQVRQAGQLEAAPAAVAAVLDGRIALAHAATIGAVTSSPNPLRREAAGSEAGQQELVRWAERMDAGTFAAEVDRWAAALDPAALEADHQAQRDQRFLHVTCTPHGTYLKGRLDTMAGHRLTLALEALSPRPAADDDRDPGQRRADALDAMAARLLTLPDTKPGGHVPPQVSLILTEETWVAARAERDRRRASHGGADGATGRAGSTAAISGPDVPGPTPPYAPATLEDGTPVPVSELAAAMCDCEITRIVLDAEQTPVDLGRAQRLFTGTQRRAVIARDRHCGWPGCDAPARWSEIHHIDWWERDTGPTSVDNAILLCSYHHHETHRRDLGITRMPREGGAAEAARPPGGPPGGVVARVGYEFRDRTGRLVAPPHPDDGPTKTVPGKEKQAPQAASEERASQLSEAELEYTTDPSTGAQVPLVMLDT